MSDRPDDRKQAQSSQSRSKPADLHRPASGPAPDERWRLGRDIPPAPMRTRSRMRGWPIIGLDFFPFVVSALSAGRGAAILGVAMVVAGLLGCWRILSVPYAISWIIAAGLVEIVGWVVLVDFWLRERDTPR